MVVLYFNDKIKINKSIEFYRVVGYADIGFL